MGLVRIDPQAQAEVEAALGQPLPEPDSAAFEALLDDLEARDPALRRRLLDAIRVEVVTPVEAQARGAARREHWRALVRRVFYREVYAGEPVLDKRRVLLAAFGVAALLVPVAALVSGFSSGPPRVVAQANPPAPPTRITPRSAPALPMQPASPTLPKPSRPVRLAIPTIPSPPVVPEPSLAMSDAPSAPAPMAAEPVRVEAPPLPLRSETALPDPGAVSSAAPITVFRREAGEDAPLSSFRLDRNDAGKNGTLEAPARPDPLTGNTSSEPTTSAAPSAPLTLYRARPSTPASEASAARVPDLPRPGARIPARLVTAVVAISGSGVPVVAETKGTAWCSSVDGRCSDLVWLGEARLDATGRVQLRFSSLVLEGQSHPVVGVGLGPDRAPGVGATLSDLAPAAAQDLLRAGLGGVGDFVKDLAERSRTTVADGMVVPGSGAAPGLLDFLLGRAASAFSLPVGQTALVRVAEVSAGTNLEVLVLPGGGSSVGP